MPEMEDMATFQQARSEFAEIVKYLIKEVAANVTHLEDHMLMQPVNDVEKRSQRDAFRDFRRAFRDLYLLTFNTVRNNELKLAIDIWFKHPYQTETKHEVFKIGMDFAIQYTTEMYKLGLLDLNVSEPVDFPFEDMIRDVSSERARQVQMTMDISHSGINTVNAGDILRSNPNVIMDISEEPVDIESLVNMEDPSILKPESDGYDMFEDEEHRIVDKIVDEPDYTDDELE
jgi:hypothetical protein